MQTHTLNQKWQDVLRVLFMLNMDAHRCARYAQAFSIEGMCLVLVCPDNNYRNAINVAYKQDILSAIGRVWGDGEWSVRAVSNGHETPIDGGLFE